MCLLGIKHKFGGNKTVALTAGYPIISNGSSKGIMGTDPPFAQTSRKPHELSHDSLPQNTLFRPYINVCEKRLVINEFDMHLNLHVEY